MTLRRNRGVAPTAVLLALLAGAATGAPDGVETSSPIDWNHFVETIDQLRGEARIPGLSIAVVVDGAVVTATGLGVSDLETGVAATADTPYDIASVTKPLSAVTILTLAERDLIDLDAPIAGFSEWVDFCEAFHQQPSIFAKNLQCDPPVHTLRHLLSHTAEGSPGERFSYNPVVYSWASRPIMAATGEPFSELVVRHVFEPAGMTRSARRHRALALPTGIADDLAPPHREDESGEMERAPPLGGQGDGAAGGVVSTVVDLAAFDIALDGGVLLTKASRTRMMQAVEDSSGRPLTSGLGWWLEEFQGEKLVWHSGWWEDAYSALYLKIPARRATLILLANSEGLWWGNPLDEAQVHRSPFARVFLDAILETAR